MPPVHCLEARPSLSICFRKHPAHDASPLQKACGKTRENPPQLRLVHSKARSPKKASNHRHQAHKFNRGLRSNVLEISVQVCPIDGLYQVLRKQASLKFCCPFLLFFACSVPFFFFFFPFSFFNTFQLYPGYHRFSSIMEYGIALVRSWSRQSLVRHLEYFGLGFTNSNRYNLEYFACSLIEQHHCSLIMSLYVVVFFLIETVPACSSTGQSNRQKKLPAHPNLSLRRSFWMFSRRDFS